jgi:hypothetical protein
MALPGRREPSLLFPALRRPSAVGVNARAVNAVPPPRSPARRWARRVSSLQAARPGVPQVASRNALSLLVSLPAGRLLRLRGRR